MTIQELGSIGELLAALATIGTLAYLAIQVRQSTRALRSSTFQEISNDMSVSSETVAAHADLSVVLVKGAENLADLSPDERLRFSFFLLMTFRRLESIFIQRRLGFIAPALTEGFERSAISVIASGGGAEWWTSAKPALSADFVAYVDQMLESTEFPRIHPGIGGSE